MPRMSLALRTGLHLPLLTESPPLAEADLQDAAAVEGEPRVMSRVRASMPVRAAATLRIDDLCFSGVEVMMPISFSCLRG